MSRAKALWLMALVNVLWGSQYAIIKVTLEAIPPMLLGALRVTVATAVLWPVVLWQLRRRGITVTSAVPRGAALRIGALGVVGVAGSSLFEYAGIQRTTSTDAALLIIGEVLFTAVLGRLILGERLGPFKRAAIIVGIVGVSVLVLGGAATAESGGPGASLGIPARVLGDLFVLAGLLCEAVFSVAGASQAKRCAPLVVVAIANTGSLIVFLPIIAFTVATNGQLPHVTLRGAAGVLYLSVIVSVVCYGLWFELLARAGAGLGAVSLFVQPLVGAALGLTLMAEPLTASVVVGGAIVVGAMYLARPRPSDEPRNNPATP